MKMYAYETQRKPAGPQSTVQACLANLCCYPLLWMSHPYHARAFFCSGRAMIYSKTDIRPTSCPRSCLDQIQPTRIHLFPFFREHHTLAMAREDQVLENKAPSQKHTPAAGHANPTLPAQRSKLLPYNNSHTGTTLSYTNQELTTRTSQI